MTRLSGEILPPTEVSDAVMHAPILRDVIAHFMPNGSWDDVRPRGEKIKQVVADEESMEKHGKLTADTTAHAGAVEQLREVVARARQEVPDQGSLGSSVAYGTASINSATRLYELNGDDKPTPVPVRGKAGYDIKRNARCPCNSGKKFKHCHRPLLASRQ